MFTMRHPNSAIRLCDGSLQLDLDGQVVSGSGMLELTWTPTPRINFKISGVSDTVHLLEPEDGRLTIHSPTRSFPVLVTSYSGRIFGVLDGGLPLTMQGVVRGRPSWRVSRSSVVSSSFHVVNFLQVFGRPVGSDGSFTNAQSTRVRIEAGDWLITLDSVPNLRTLVEALRHRGGFAITHLGRLERHDGHAYSTQRAEEVLEDLFFALSFARGGWSGPVLVTHHSGSDEPVAEVWSVPRLDSWSGRHTWFDSTMASALSPLLLGIMLTSSDPVLRGDVRVALSLFVEANAIHRRKDRYFSRRVVLNSSHGSVSSNFTGSIAPVSSTAFLPMTGLPLCFRGTGWEWASRDWLGTSAASPVETDCMVGQGPSPGSGMGSRIHGIGHARIRQRSKSDGMRCS